MTRRRICFIMRYFGKKDRNSKFSADLFVTLSIRIAQLQSPDRYWHARLPDPGSYPRIATRDITEGYGVGAFLSAGSQIYKMAN